MKTKIISLFLITAMCLSLIGCNTTAKKTVDPISSENSQYVITLNPYVVSPDGTTKCVRNDVAKSMSQDYKSKTTSSFYNKTNWNWIYADEKGNWERRKVRSLSTWVSSSGKTAKGLPFAYTLNDSGTTSLCAYDSSKMKMSGYADTDIGKSGIVMSFEDDREEAVCYIADTDETVGFSDISGGNVSVLKSFAGIKTGFFDSKNAKKSIVLRLYVNNRIYWQEILNKDTSSVLFPSIDNIELKTGDVIIFSAQATDDTEGIVTGNCDIPAKTKDVFSKTPIYGEESNSETETEELMLVSGGMADYAIVRPASATEKEKSLITSFSKQLSDNLNADFDVSDDSASVEGNCIYVYNTKYSSQLISEIKNKRKENAGDFIIRVKDKNIYIAAVSEFGLEFALDFFRKNYGKDSEKPIPKDLNYISANHNPIKPISLGGSKITNYRIVISHVSSFVEKSAADYIQKEIVRMVGEKIAIVNDNTKASGKEITVGDTNRTSNNYSTVANNNATKNYTINVTSNRTSITGGQIYAVNAGAIKFISLLDSKKTLANGKYTGTYDGGYTLTNGYKLAWADEFNGDKLSKNWISKAGNPSENNAFGGKTYLSAANNVLNNGALEQWTIKDGNDLTYASIYSQGAAKMLFQYGYIEIRAKFSTVPGICNTFWTQADPASEFLEIDFYENFGYPDVVKSNLHTWEPGGGHRNLMGGTGSTLNNSDGVEKPFGTEYHTIGLEWDKNMCTFYVDGVVSSKFDCSSSEYSCFAKPAWLILSSDASDSLSTYSKFSITEDFVSSFSSYDWIHIYQKADNGSILYEKGGAK